MEITCRDQVLLPLWTLEYVRDNIWFSGDVAPMILPDTPSINHLMTLHYRRSKKDGQVHEPPRRWTSSHWLEVWSSRSQRSNPSASTSILSHSNPFRNSQRQMTSRSIINSFSFSFAELLLSDKFQFLLQYFLISSVASILSTDLNFTFFI